MYGYRVSALCSLLCLVTLLSLGASRSYAQPSGSYFDDTLAEYPEVPDSQYDDSANTGDPDTQDQDDSSGGWLAGTVAKAFGTSAALFFDAAYKLVRYVLCRLTLFTLLTIFPVATGLVSIWQQCVGTVFDFSGLSWFLGAANYWFPVSESMAMFCGLLILSLACAAIRWILKAVPTIG